MATLTILLTLLVLGVAMYKGYRFSLRLYTRQSSSSAGRSKRVAEEPDYFESSQQEEGASLAPTMDYGLGYARTGLWLLVILVGGVLAILLFFLLVVAR